MNRLLLACCLSLATLSLWGQLAPKKSFTALSARVLAIDHNLPNETINGASPTYAIELGIRRQLTKHLALAAPLKLGIIDVGQLDNLLVSSVDLLAQVYPLGNERKVFPYLQAGVGIMAERFDDANHQIPLGFGLNFRLAANSWFNVQAEYRRSNQTARNNVMAGLGYIYRLSEADSDKDGVPNRLDRCPDAPGPTSTNGCPDKDADGIADADDRCPEFAGLPQYNGCPDTDRDGVIDPEDACPETAGPATTKGCPDTDGDGIPDADDRCPDVAGAPTYDGCPDTDGDGLPDDQDICPEKAGPHTLMGCPDGDGDGIPDMDDRCPEQAGGAPLGCPDSDGDGLQDAEDACPNTPGTINGCPDTDGDGIADDVDRCPSQKGAPENGGCPFIETAVQDQLAYAARAIQFETGSAKLKESSYVILSEIGGIMRQYPDYNLSISGHTDNVGSDITNLRLSQRRAQACQDFIIATGISPNRVSSAGFGESRPAADNATAEGRRQNRRVLFELIPRRR